MKGQSMQQASGELLDAATIYPAATSLLLAANACRRNNAACTEAATGLSRL